MPVSSSSPSGTAPGSAPGTVPATDAGAAPPRLTDRTALLRQRARAERLGREHWLDTLVQAVVPNGAAYRLVFVFLLVIGVLVFRPAGLFGRTVVEKV